MTDEITVSQIIKRIPETVLTMPARVKGLMLAANTDTAKPSGIGLCFEDAVARNPNGTCVIYQDREYSYDQFNRKINQIAHCLDAMGVRKGDVVSVFLESRPELLAVTVAIAKLGAVAAMINHSQRGDVLVHSVNLVSPKMAIVGAELIEGFRAVQKKLSVAAAKTLYVPDEDGDGASVPCPKAYGNLHDLVTGFPESNPKTTALCKAGEPSFYFYTSGTTGLPKAAIFTHGRYMKAYGGIGIASIQLKKKDRVIITLPFYHATALVVCWGAAIAGASGIVMERKFSASRFWDTVRKHRVTAIGYVGELCRYLIEQKPKASDSDNAVRLMFGNGLRPNIWKDFKNRFGIKKVYEFYGSSEGNVGFLNMFNFDQTVGFTPVPYAIVQYDTEKDEPIRFSNGFMRKVSRGEAGLLLGEISDKAPFDGYTDPEKTEKTILRNVFKVGDAWFNTGDMMRDQGFRHAQFVDRLGDTFRWKGENVSTTEVENTISLLPEILEAVVYGVEIPNTNGRAGMAAIRLSEDKSFDGSSMHQHLASKLPSYAVPMFIRITDEMEKTGTFKYTKVHLKKVGYDCTQTRDNIWVCLPGEKSYQKVDKSLFTDIQKGKYRF